MQESIIQNWWNSFLQQVQEPERSVALKEASLAENLGTGLD